MMPCPVPPLYRRYYLGEQQMVSQMIQKQIIPRQLRLDRMQSSLPRYPRKHFPPLLVVPGAAVVVEGEVGAIDLQFAVVAVAVGSLAQN